MAISKNQELLALLQSGADKVIDSMDRSQTDALILQVTSKSGNVYSMKITLTSRAQKAVVSKTKKPKVKNDSANDKLSDNTGQVHP